MQMYMSNRHNSDTSDECQVHPLFHLELQQVKKKI